MAEEDSWLRILIKEGVMDRIEHPCDSQSDLVMIPDDQAVLAVQRTQNPTGFLYIHRPPEHISAMPCEVVLRDFGVSPVDQLARHIFERFEGTVAHRKNSAPIVVVPVMFVRSVESHKVPIVTLSTVQAVQ